MHTHTRDHLRSHIKNVHVSVCIKFEIKTRWMGRWEPIVAVSGGASRGQCLSSQVPTEPRFTLISAKQQQKVSHVPAANLSCVHSSK